MTINVTGLLIVTYKKQMSILILFKQKSCNFCITYRGSPSNICTCRAKLNIKVNENVLCVSYIDVSVLRTDRCEKI